MISLDNELLPPLGTFKRMIDVIPEFICIKKPDGTWLEANQFALDMFGIQIENYRGKSTEFLQSHLTAATIHRCRLSDHEAWEKRAAVKTVEEIETLHGSKIVLELVKQPTFDRDGNPLILIITGRDITPHKQKEEELSVALDLLESVLKGATDAILILNTRRECIKVNEAFEKMFGWTEEEFIDFEDEPPVITPNHLREASNKIMEQLQEGTSIPIYETQRIKKNGDMIDVSVSFSTISDMEGRLMGFVIIYRDISSQKKVERALRESEAKYRLIAEHSTDLIAVIEPDGKFQYASPSYSHVLGYSSDILDCSLVDLLHPDDTEDLINCFTQVLVKKQPFQVEFCLKHVHGHWVTVETNGVPILNDHGRVESIVTFGRDVTKAKKTEELIRKSEKLSVLGELAAGVAHEIRNPLTSLKGFTKLLHEADGEIKGEYLRIMESELNRINEIVGELMLVAKPQAVSFEYANLSEIINSVVLLLETQAIIKNIQIIVKMEKDLPPVYGVENQIKQLFINLLKNAIESMENEGIITLELERKELAVQMTIQDQGCGIPKDRLKTLGEPFYTTKDKGTGLGLMVCFKIMEEHSGEIEFSSEEGKGTRVEVLLPTHPPARPFKTHR
ncbi:PAS domain S-box protein [Fictibacillus iocasae]|uniref:histidine kinase n=1 Tax=Fictibacillus iocasae TaxID=2715437 RepID=A0ABW2NID8_9BACL